MILTINIATRGRPELLRDTIATTLKNITLPDTRLMVSCDDDDGDSVEVASSFPAVTVSIERREDSVGAKWNRAIAACPADAYYPMVDHSPVVTPGFDKLIRETLSIFPDGYGYAAGPLINPFFPCAQIVSHRLAVAMGGIYPTYWPYWFVDHWLDDIVKMLGRDCHVALEVDVSRRPQKTQEMRDLYFWASLYDALAVKRHEMCRRIFADPDFTTPKWMQRMLRTGWAQIDRRSFAINSGCREQAKAMEENRGATPPDERYLRIRAKAMDLIKDAYRQLKAA